MIEVNGVTKYFGNFPAITDINFRVEPGEIVGFLGPNGAGKSTLVKMMYGVLEPTAGTFLWKGTETEVRSPAEARARHRHGVPGVLAVRGTDGR